VTPKVRAKARAVHDFVARAMAEGKLLSNLAVDSAVGLGLYAHCVLREGGEPSAAMHWRLLRAYRVINRAIGARRDEWANHAQLSDEVLQDLLQWMEAVEHSAAIPVATGQEKPDVLLFVDASQAGYGAVLVDVASSYCYVVRRKFPRPVKASVEAEPVAIAAVVKEVEASTKRAKLVVVTDHQAFTHAYRKGFSPNPNYNVAILALRKPALRRIVDVQFLEGFGNTADEPSRDLPVDPSKVREATERILGRFAWVQPGLRPPCPAAAGPP
jgi:hypothetical protein